MALSLPATSILELLTHPNPSVSHQIPKSKTNTRSPRYYYPRQIKKWEELEDVNILKDVFGGLFGTRFFPSGHLEQRRSPIRQRGISLSSPTGGEEAPSAFTQRVFEGNPYEITIIVKTSARFRVHCI
ncbi:hypothetical protein LB505_008562 [Fusarium chuoi]|nr:hypothetical protein LB505_008562 [Fusarium chuoi]